MAADDAWLGRVEGTVIPVLASHGLSLVDIEWHREGRRWVLRLFVDKPDGVSIGDCQTASRETGDVLDAAGLIEPAYDLEVSSPGLDRELKKDREYAWATGKAVRCWLREPVDGRLEFTGRLVSVSGSALGLAEPDGSVRDLPRALVAKARLVPDVLWSRKPGRH